MIDDCTITPDEEVRKTFQQTFVNCMHWTRVCNLWITQRLQCCSGGTDS